MISPKDIEEHNKKVAGRVLGGDIKPSYLTASMADHLIRLGRSDMVDDCYINGTGTAPKPAMPPLALDGNDKEAAQNMVEGWANDRD